MENGLDYTIIKDPVFRQAVEMIDVGAVDKLRIYLQQYPDLIHQQVKLADEGYFSNPYLLEFIAENPVRKGKLPTAILDIIKVILEAGAQNNLVQLDNTLSLVSSGRIVRECEMQIPIIDLLCASGANPNHAMLPALAHGEFEAVQTLLAKGAEMNLFVAAATGQQSKFEELLPKATEMQRHLALAFAVQFNHAGILQLLLSRGENPNRYNPAGAHAHSTPLHQAVINNNVEIIKLLIESGADPDIRILYFRGHRWIGQFTKNEPMLKPVF